MNSVMIESIVINLLLLFHCVSLQTVDVVMEKIKSVGKEAYLAEPFELNEINPPQSDPDDFQYVCQQGFHLFDMQGYFQATDARECAQKCASLEKCRAFNFVRSISMCFPLGSSTADYDHLWNDSTINPYHCNVTRAMENESVPLYAFDVQSRAILPRLLNSGVPFFKPNVGNQDHNMSSDAVVPFSYPWMVGINACDKTTRKCAHCDGVLIPWHADNDEKSIASDCVLTAAHCVKNASNGEWFQPFDIEVIAGNHGQNLFEAFEQHRVAATIYTHAGYGGDGDSEMYDIALIRTKELIYLNKYAIPVRLPERHFPANPLRCIVAGWSDPTIGGQMSPVLKQARMKILPNDQCAGKSQDRLPLCAKGIDHGAVCPAESSGPIVCPEQIGGEEAFVVYGITPLTGDGSCFSKPIAFTQLFSHMNWIKTVADDSIRKLFLNKHIVEKDEKN